MIDELAQLLAAGGDVFTIGVCIAIYRLHDRVTKLELSEAVRLGKAG